MTKNLVAQVGKPGGDFELVERDIPRPGPGEVRIKVEACGVCHSDSATKEGIFPWIQYPRIPGHEIAGVIDELGAGVTEWKKGDRVGVGWHGGHCFVCESCRRGDFITCKNEQITGVTRDGGYQQYMLARHEAIAAMPPTLDSANAGPLLCAGITTYNSLRHSGALPGDLVAVLGIGGLGHLGIQFAARFGYRTVGVGRGPENGDLAKKLGASEYIDSNASSAADELQKMGGASVILATAPSAKAMAELIGGLKPGGKLLAIGVPAEPLQVSLGPLIMGKRDVQGWPSGTAIDSEDTLRFSALTGVRPMIEKFPLKEVKNAFNRMMSGEAQFRVVLTM
jgi:D-arabinose 1-dehydrogenase-like Zn-dependent alcohol dehydrogenase